MINHLDFYLTMHLHSTTPCTTSGCKNTPKEMPFYLTEWEFQTGASTDGIYYCEECVRKHLGLEKEEEMGVLEELKCQGYRRRGGIFTLGPIEWGQCTEIPDVILTIEGKEPMPACRTCWKECIENKINITKVEPIG